MKKLIRKMQKGKRIFKDGQVTTEKINIPSTDSYYSDSNGNIHRGYQVQDRDTGNYYQVIFDENGQPKPIVQTDKGLQAYGNVNFQPEYYINDAGGNVVVTPNGNRIEYFPDHPESIPWVEDDQLLTESDKEKTITNGSPVVNEFFQYDVAPRLRKEAHTSYGVEDLPKSTYINYFQEETPTTGYYTDEHPDRVNLNLLYRPSNRTLVHELTHNYRQGKLNKLSSHPNSGYSNEEAKMLNDAYDETGLKLDYPILNEKGTTNTSLRYTLWRELYDKLGRVPSVKEVNQYINNYDETKLVEKLLNINGYSSDYFGPNAFYRDNFQDFMNQKVKKALIHVAQNKSNNIQNNV